MNKNTEDFLLIVIPYIVIISYKILEWFIPSYWFFIWAKDYNFIIRILPVIIWYTINITINNLLKKKYFIEKFS